MVDSKVAVVTGTSSGLGLSISVQLAAQGYKVYATMRDTTKSVELLQKAEDSKISKENLLVEAMDVSNDKSVTDCIQKILAESKKIDVLVANAGQGQVAGIEQSSIDDAKKVMDVNYYGVIRCMQAVLPNMRQNKSGRIIAISSVGGRIGMPFNDLYCGAKFALEGMFECQAPVYRQLGIHLSVVQPGGISSKFRDNVDKGNLMKFDNCPELGPLVQKFFAGMQKMMVIPNYVQTPDECAECVIQAIKDEKPRLRYLSNRNWDEIISKNGADLTGNYGQDELCKRYFD